MDGINAQTGRALAGLDHLRQSITDILTTPIGSRVMRRDYGSRIYELVDAPINQSTLLDLFAATVEAIQRWEPRFKVTRVFADTATAGSIALTMVGDYLPDGRTIEIDGIVVK